MTDLAVRSVSTPAPSGPSRADSPGTRPAESGGADAGDRMSFWDFLDVINPLHHIPVVGSIYRQITGDEIKAPARLAGGALFGGPVGFIAGLAETVVEKATGRDFAGHAVALIDGKGETPAVAESMPAEAAVQKAPVAAAALPPAPAGEPALEGEAALAQFLADAGLATNDASALPLAEATAPDPVALLGPDAADAPGAAKPAFGGLVVAQPSSQAAAAVAQLDRAASALPLPGQAVAPDLIAQTMMQALDKYQRMQAASGTVRGNI